MLDTLNRINDHIRDPGTLAQMQKACQHLGLLCLNPVPLSQSPGYVSGLFDSDGSVTIEVSGTTTPGPKPGEVPKSVVLTHSRGHHQLSVHTDSRDELLLNLCKQSLGIGKVSLKNPSPEESARRPNVGYRWYWRSFE